MSASITLIGSVTEAHGRSLQTWLSSYSIEGKCKTLTDSSDSYVVERWELSKTFPEDKEKEVRKELLAWADRDQIDYVYQNKSIDVSQGGLAVFDMDSTLIKAEVIDELAVEAGIGEKIALITASAMRGEIDFSESFTQRLALLDGLSSDRMDTVFERIHYMDGIEKLMKVLNHFNWHTAILSGGFTFFADKIKDKFQFSEVHANVLEIEAGKLTGRHIGPIVNAERKKYLLEEISQRNNINIEQSVACGDGANDLLMLNTTTLGVALHAKPLVREQAPHPVSQLGLESVLYLLGMSSSEISEIFL